IPASVGSTRRPERSRSCVPSRFSSARTCRLTAGCVTPSRSAACEKLRRSTTAQKAASCRVSISECYASAPPAARAVYDRPVAERLEDTLVRGYTRLAADSPRRWIDVELRLLDLVLAAAFSLLLLPVAVGLSAAILLTDGLPILYHGQRVGRHGHFFRIFKFRTLRRDAEERLGPYLGDELVRRTDVEYTKLGRWLKSSQLDEIPQLW